MKYLLFCLCAFVLAACAPAAGKPALTVKASTKDVVRATISACPAVAPSAHDYLSVESVGSNEVVCRASVRSDITLTAGAVWLLAIILVEAASADDIEAHPVSYEEPEEAEAEVLDAPTFEDQSVRVSVVDVGGGLSAVTVSSSPENAVLEQTLEDALLTRLRTP